MPTNDKKSKKQREGWYEAIISEGMDDKELLPEFSNEFDGNEWEWKDTSVDENSKK